MENEKLLSILKDAMSKIDEAILLLSDPSTLSTSTAPIEKEVSPAEIEHDQKPAEIGGEEQKPVENKVTIDDIRTKLATIAGNGHKAAVKKLLEKYGSTKVSGIDPTNYEALMRDAVEVENAK